VAQQARNLPIALDDHAGQLRLLVHDRDTKFPATFDGRLRRRGDQGARYACAGAAGERVRGALGGTVRREVGDWMLVLGCRQLRSVLAEYANQYDLHRPHRALDRRRHAGPACQSSWRRLRGSRDEVASVG
jgi:putative transposase